MPDQVQTDWPGRAHTENQQASHLVASATDDSQVLFEMA